MAEGKPRYMTLNEIYNEMVKNGKMRIHQLSPGMDEAGDGLAERVSEEIYCLLGARPISHKLYVNSINRNYYLWLSVESLGRERGYIMSCLKDWFGALILETDKCQGIEAVPVSVKTFGEAAYLSLELSLPPEVQEANIREYVRRTSRVYMAEIAQANDLYSETH